MPKDTNKSTSLQSIWRSISFDFSHNIMYSCLASKIICIVVHQIKRQRLLARSWPSVFRCPISSYPSTPPATLPSTALRYQTHLKRFWWRIFSKSTIGRLVADIRYLMVYLAYLINCVFVGVFQYQISNIKFQGPKGPQRVGWWRGGIPEASVVSLSPLIYVIVNL